MTATNELTVPEQQTKQLAERVGAFSDRINELNALPTGTLKASMGQDLIQDARDYMKAVGGVFDHIVANAFRVHRELTALRGKFLKPGEIAENAGRMAVRDYEDARRRKLEEERRKLEEANRLAEQKRREEELAALKQQDAPKEVIEQRAAAPLDVPAAVVDEDKGKLSGVSTAEKWRFDPSRLTQEQRTGLLHHIASNPGLHHFLLFEISTINRFLTANHGQGLPGMEGAIFRDDTIRVRGARED